MTIGNFVESQLGTAKRVLLENIRRGGDNNAKGSKYEDFYAVASMCQLAAHDENLDDIEISSQEVAFVDDLTIRHFSTGKKCNYQLKNSDGSAADWTDDTTERFRDQHTIDTQFHKFGISQQYLIVSSASKAEANASKIPDDLAGLGFCESFPFQPNTFQLIQESKQLKMHLSTICQSDDLQVLDTAFKIVLSVWASSSDCPRKTSKIFEEAKSISRPNLFRMGEKSVPEWLVGKIGSFKDMHVHVEFGHFVVSYRGFQVTLGSGFDVPTTEELDVLSTAGEFMKFLMQTMHAELNDAN